MLAFSHKTIFVNTKLQIESDGRLLVILRHAATFTPPPLADAVMHCPPLDMCPVVLLYAHALMPGMSEQLNTVHSPPQFSWNHKETCQKGPISHKQRQIVWL